MGESQREKVIENLNEMKKEKMHFDNSNNNNNINSNNNNSSSNNNNTDNNIGGSATQKILQHILASSNQLLSISPIFNLQLFQQFSFAKKLPIQTLSIESCARHFRMEKLLIKCGQQEPILPINLLASRIFRPLNLALAQQAQFLSYATNSQA